VAVSIAECSSRGVLNSTTDHQHLRCVSPNMVELKNHSCKCVLSGIEYVLMCSSYPNLDCNIRCFLSSLSKAIDIDVEHYAKSSLYCHSGLWFLFSASGTAYITTTYIDMYVDSGACCFMGLMAPSILNGCPHFCYLDVACFVPQLDYNTQNNRDEPEVIGPRHPDFILNERRYEAQDPRRPREKHDCILIKQIPLLSAPEATNILRDLEFYLELDFENDLGSRRLSQETHCLTIGLHADVCRVPSVILTGTYGIHRCRNPLRDALHQLSLNCASLLLVRVPVAFNARSFEPSFADCIVEDHCCCPLISVSVTTQTIRNIIIDPYYAAYLYRSFDYSACMYCIDLTTRPKRHAQIENLNTMWLLSKHSSGLTSLTFLEIDCNWLAFVFRLPLVAFPDALTRGCSWEVAGPCCNPCSVAAQASCRGPGLGRQSDAFVDLLFDWSARLLKTKRGYCPIRSGRHSYLIEIEGIAEPCDWNNHVLVAGGVNSFPYTVYFESLFP